MADLFEAIEQQLADGVAAIQAKIDDLKSQINAGGMSAEEEAAAQAKLQALADQVSALGQP